MTDDDVGYGKPPKNNRFKPGVSGNPKGRPKRTQMALAQIIGDALKASIEYRDQGRTRITSRLELRLKLLVDRAVKGSVSDATRILEVRAHAQKFGDGGIERFIVTNWMPDYPGQTAAQKTQEFAAAGEAHSVEWWNAGDQAADKSSEIAQEPKQTVDQ